MTRIPLCFVALLATSTTASAASQNTMCYFPDGTPSPTDFVCNSTTGDGFSSCCGHQNDGSQAYCLSNGLCMSDMFLSRGSCTDKSWNSPNCAQVCTKQSPGSGLGIRPCGYTGKWDCGNGTGCANHAINIPTGTWVFTDAQLANVTDDRTHDPSSSSTTPTTGILTSPAVVTVTAAAAPSSGTSAATVGAAVGVPLGILAVAFLALWLFERQRLGKARQQLATASAPSLVNPPLPPSSEPPTAPPSAMGSISNTGAFYAAPAGISRMSSQYSNGMSPVTAQPRSQSMHFDQSIFRQQQQQQQQVSRMPSNASSLPAHPAYNREVRGSLYSPTDVSGPAAPIKTFNLKNPVWLAEAPSDNFKGRPRNMSQVQELPAEM